MDREAFLKLLVAQLRNQDPLKPMEGTEFVTQLSQFSVVEQAIEQSRSIERLGDRLGALEQVEATGLLGRVVTMDQARVRLGSVGGTTLNGSLTQAAAMVRAEVVDGNGNSVRTLTLGPRGAGVLSVPWDGMAEDGSRAPEGLYTVRFQAATVEGNPVAVTTRWQDSVVAVGRDANGTRLTLNSGATVPLSEVDSISVR